mmetsp:Transcript_35566/g.82352  ORF Transcript_35566/g.82352 Transcript_35566/m.82352 type:complete len:107 (+) Transcript_35566:205-525(+)
MLHAHARANNISALEACLDANPSQVDLQDADGNTPLLAAVQTNSKRSNHRGQPALHFCFALGHHELGEYLISKGADSSLLNAEGLTCFEGCRLHDQGAERVGHFTR